MFFPHVREIIEHSDHPYHLNTFNLLSSIASFVNPDLIWTDTVFQNMRGSRKFRHQSISQCSVQLPVPVFLSKHNYYSHLQFSKRSGAGSGLLLPSTLWIRPCGLYLSQTDATRAVFFVTVVIFCETDYNSVSYASHLRNCVKFSRTGKYGL